MFQPIQKKMKITRTRVLGFSLIPITFGMMLASFFASFNAKSNVQIFHINPFVIGILFSLLCAIVMLPDLFGGEEILLVNDKAFQILPKQKHFEKLRMLVHLLIYNNIDPFLKTIYLQDVKSIELNFTKHFGTYNFNRYTFVLTYTIVDNTKITQNINDMSKGVLLTFPTAPYPSFLKPNDFLNLLQYFSSNNIPIMDPYHLQEAFKNPNIVLYDYLETLDKKTRY